MISPAMQYSGLALTRTETAEGLRLTAYQDSGERWTIGYGHTGPEVLHGLTCTPEQAGAWLSEDMAWACAAVNNAVRVPLTQGEFDALCDFTFNVGCGSFISSTLLRDLNAGSYTAASSQLPLWDLCAGIKNEGLVNRRAMEQGEWNETEN